MEQVFGSLRHGDDDDRPNKLMEQPVPLRNLLLSQGGDKFITRYVCDRENDKEDFPPWTRDTRGVPKSNQALGAFWVGNSRLYKGMRSALQAWTVDLGP